MEPEETQLQVELEPKTCKYFHNFSKWIGGTNFSFRPGGNQYTMQTAGSAGQTNTTQQDPSKMQSNAMGQQPGFNMMDGRSGGNSMPTGGAGGNDMSNFPGGNAMGMNPMMGGGQNMGQFPGGGKDF